MGGGWTTSKLSSEVSMAPRSHVDTAQAAPSKLTLKEDPECYFYGGKVLLGEGFITPQVSATWLAPPLPTAGCCSVILQEMGGLWDKIRP